MNYKTHTTFQIGDLVMYEDLREGSILCVIIAGGVSGYGSDSRQIYVVYSMLHAGIYLSYDSELSLLRVT